MESATPFGCRWISTSGQGICFSSVEFWGHNFIASVVVVKGLTEDAILGLDFLQQHQCIVDCGQHLLRFSGRNLAIPLDMYIATQTTTRPTPVTAVLKQTVIVPA